MGRALPALRADFHADAARRADEADAAEDRRRRETLDPTDVDTLFADRAAWAERALRNIAGMGPFSSDRTIAEYVERVWSVKSLDH